jgi:hypothetical protein
MRRSPKGWSIFVLTTLALGVAPACGDDDDDGPSGHPEGVGNHCAEDSDCPTGTCYIGPGGGYCTAPCSGEGSTDGCPADTVCKPIQGGAERCLLICGSASTCGETDCPDEYCPSGSSCVAVSNTSHHGCEPDPT